MKHEGFYLTLGKRELFFVTERKRKDKGTLDAILECIAREHGKSYLPTESQRRELDYWLSKATAEVRYTETTKMPFWHIAYGKGSSVMMPYAELEIIELEGK